MSRFRDAVAAACTVVLLAGPALAGPLGLGRVATEDEIRAWDIDVRPDGLGLPEGSGSVAEGEVLYGERCAMCHGDFGEGVDRWPVLAGGRGTLTSDRPVKTIGSYWPYFSTVWDYVHRAMPFGQALSLDDDEVYAIAAYLLYLNDLVPDDFELTRENFTGIHLPNENGFYDDPRPDIPLLARDGPPCMKDCKQKVEITMRARVLDVTPDDAESRRRRTASGPTGAEVAGTEVAGTDATGTDATGTEAATKTAAPAGGGAETDAALLARGEKVFAKCKACHAVGEGAKNKIGPHLNGVLGRRAGSVEGFRYSKAMAARGEEGLAWTPETLDAFLAAPKKFIPGTRMSFAGLAEPGDRAALITYLRRYSP